MRHEPEKCMPASNKIVTIENARDWARRLQKNTPALSKLSDAQKAVASMLGHASWYALNNFYKNQESSQTPMVNSTAPVEKTKEKASLTFDEFNENALAIINERYPDLKAQSIQEMASQFEYINGDANDIINLAQEIETNEDYSYSDSLEEALERNQVKIHMPKGNLLYRVICENGQHSFVLFTSADYDLAYSVKPQKKKKTPHA